MKYAIVESGGKQYRAVEGGTLEVDRLPVEAGANLKLDQILLLADGETITVGTPLVKDNPIWTTVLGHFKGEKLTIFNYSPKKRIRIKTGHRQNYTRLLVEQIGGTSFEKKVMEKKTKKVVKLEAGVETSDKVIEKPVRTEPKVEKATPAAKKSAAPAAKPARKPAEKSSTTSKTSAAKASEKKPARSAAKPAAKPATKPAAKKPAAKKPTARKPAEKK